MTWYSASWATMSPALSLANRGLSCNCKEQWRTQALSSSVDALCKDSSPSACLPQKKHWWIGFGNFSRLLRVYFLGLFELELSSGAAFLFSARWSFVLLNFSLHESCHLALCCWRLASIPSPSFNRDRFIVLGKQPIFSKAFNPLLSWYA